MSMFWEAMNRSILSCETISVAKTEGVLRRDTVSNVATSSAALRNLLFIMDSPFYSTRSPKEHLLALADYDRILTSVLDNKGTVVLAVLVDETRVAVSVLENPTELVYTILLANGPVAHAQLD